MAVVTRSGSKSESTPSKSQDIGFFGVFFKFTLIIFLFTFVIGSILLYHNCQVAEKGWIPRSQGFCNDFAWSVQNMRIRNTLFDNFRLTVESFSSVLFQQFSTSEKLNNNIGEKTTQFFNKFKEFIFSTVAFLDENFGEFFENLWELFSNVSINFFNFLSEISSKVLDSTATYSNQFLEIVQPYYERFEKTIQNWRH